VIESPTFLRPIHLLSAALGHFLNRYLDLRPCGWIAPFGAFLFTRSGFSNGIPVKILINPIVIKYFYEFS
jgi:hypothetical protein